MTFDHRSLVEFLSILQCFLFDRVGDESVTVVQINITAKIIISMAKSLHSRLPHKRALSKSTFSN